jgi:hypothetical protein
MSSFFQSQWTCIYQGENRTWIRLRSVERVQLVREATPDGPATCKLVVTVGGHDEVYKSGIAPDQGEHELMTFLELVRFAEQLKQ